MRFWYVDKLAVLNGYIRRLCVSPSYDATSDFDFQVFVHRMSVRIAMRKYAWSDRMHRAHKSRSIEAVVCAVGSPSSLSSFLPFVLDAVVMSIWT